MTKKNLLKFGLITAGYLGSCAVLAHVLSMIYNWCIDHFCNN